MGLKHNLINRATTLKKLMFSKYLIHSYKDKLVTNKLQILLQISSLEKKNRNVSWTLPKFFGFLAVGPLKMIVDIHDEYSIN